MEMSLNDDLDINLEPTVLLALSRLQKATAVKRRAAGVPCKKIVEFLKANFPWVDGDVDSQVMTALLSSVKNGIVCALNNKKFLLVKATAKKMISNCVTRVSHGPKCCCLPTLKCMLKAFPRTCCYVKKSGSCPVKKIKKSPTRAKTTSKPKSPPTPRRRKKPCPPPRKKCEKSCAQNAQNQIGTSKSALSICEKTNTACNYCLEIHSLPKLKKLCMTCYPIGKLEGVPPDTFSPRDEKTPPVETILSDLVPNAVKHIAPQVVPKAVKNTVK